MSRKFRVDRYSWVKTAGLQIKGKTSKYIVTDCEEDETEEMRPPVATFHISMAHDDDIQKIRAYKLAEFLNTAQEKVDVINILSGMTMAP